MLTVSSLKHRVARVRRLMRQTEETYLQVCSLDGDAPEYRLRSIRLVMFLSDSQAVRTDRSREVSFS